MDREPPAGFAELIGSHFVTPAMADESGDDG
jgi:hypothetical protein